MRLFVGLLSRAEENLRLLGLRLLLSFVPLLPAEPPPPQQDGAQASWTMDSKRPHMLSPMGPLQMHIAAKLFPASPCA